MLSSKDYIRVVTLIYVTTVSFTISLLAISIWEIAPQRERQYDVHYMLAVALIFILALYFSYRISSKYIDRGKQRRGIREKLLLYRKALYIQWSFLALMSLSAITSYIMTAENFFIFATVFAILLFLVSRPSIGKTINDLDLDDTDTRILQTPDAAL